MNMMTDSDAYALLDFIERRMHLWTIAIGSDNPRGVMDFRFKSGRIAHQILRECNAFFPRGRDFAEAIQQGADPVSQWPEHMQEFVRFCFWHRAPKKDPLTPQSKIDRLKQSLEPLPDFINQYDKPVDEGTLPPVPQTFKALEVMYD